MGLKASYVIQFWNNFSLIISDYEEEISGEHEGIVFKGLKEEKGIQEMS